MSKDGFFSGGIALSAVGPMAFVVVACEAAGFLSGDELLG